MTELQQTQSATVISLSSPHKMDQVGIYLNTDVFTGYSFTSMIKECNMLTKLRVLSYL